MLDPEGEIHPPTYTDVVNSTRYPVLRRSSERLFDVEAAEQTLVIPEVGVIVPPPGGIRLPLPEVPGPQWRLRFVDFTPHLPTGSGGSQIKNLNNFDLLISRANNWLDCNRNVKVMSCETVTWRANNLSQLNDTDIASLTIKPSNKLYFMRGLRVWIAPRWGIEDQDQVKIGMRDYEPDLSLENEMDVSTFVKIVNNKIQENPLPGRPMKMETVVKRTSPHVKCKDCYWTEMPNSSHSYAFFFRIFYIRGPQSRDVIGVRDFHPERLYPSTRKYESYERVSQKAKEWMASQITVNILNLQTILIKRKDSRVKNSHSRLVYTVHSSKPVAFLQTLRVCFIRPRNNMAVEVLPSLHFCKKTFAPQRKPVVDEIEISDEMEYESFSRTTEQVSAWIKNNRTSIISVETAQTRLRKKGRPSHHGAESTLVWSFESVEEHWLTHIRIFIPDRSSLDRPPTPPTPRYLNFTSFGQPWYMRRRSTSASQRNKRCLIAMAVTGTLLVLIGVAGALYYFLVYKN